MLGKKKKRKKQNRELEYLSIWVPHQSFGRSAETFGGVPRRGGDIDLTMFFKNFNITTHSL